MNKEERISIKASPQKREMTIQIIPIIEDVSVERNTISDRDGENSSKKVENNLNIKNDNLGYINEIFVEELVMLSKSKIGLQALERMLKNFEEIRTISKEISKQMEIENQVFVTPKFQKFDKLRMKMIEKPPSQSPSEIDEPQNTKLIQFDSDTKIKLVKLKKYFNVLNKKLKRFISKERKRLPKRLSHTCKFCGLIYDTGRQLGGHISRMHTGQSEAFLHKVTIHKINKQQRNRRLHWKNKNRSKKEHTPQKIKLEKEVMIDERTKTAKKQRIDEKSEDIYIQE